MPHTPQCVVVLSVSTQAPAQLVMPAPHLSEQRLSEHTSPARHFSVHEPQRAGSLDTSTHVPSHFSSGVWQLTPHAPLTQVGVPPSSLHFSPQPPQLSGSSSKLTHTVPHGL